jgi:predicted ribosome quality control (RQC) complex YloA/Tae2 family protein
MVKRETIMIDDKEYVVLIGQNAQENTAIIRQCDPNDMWFHLKSSSSPHVILKTENTLIHKRYLNQIASLVYKYKNMITREPVIYTEIKNVKLTSTPGLVVPSRLREIRF